MTYVSRMFDSRDIPHFDSLMLSNTFLCNFLLVFYFGWQHCIHVSSKGWFVLVPTYFQIKQFFWFLLEILSFSFCLVNSEHDAYLPVDRSLVYSHSKESALELDLKPTFSIHISVSFCLLFLDLASCRIWVLSSTFSSL